jgi:hypothetical protein
MPNTKRKNVKMKVKKFNEEIQTKNFSDMENWSGDKKVVYSGTKKIDYGLGSKVIDLLAEYGLGVVSVGKGKWLHGQKLVLPDETNFQEYRVQLGKKQDWDDFIENYNDEKDADYDNLSEEEQEKIKDSYNELPYEVDRYDEIEFSVFLPNNIENLESAAMSDASTYLKLLKNSGLDDIIEGHCEYQIFFDYPKEVTNFINGKKIVITNKNLEIVKTVSYRLYKDSKVFTLLEANIGDNETKQLINDWLNLIK